MKLKDFHKMVGITDEASRMAYYKIHKLGIYSCMVCDEIINNTLQGCPNGCIPDVTPSNGECKSEIVIFEKNVCINLDEKDVLFSIIKKREQHLCIVLENNINSAGENVVNELQILKNLKSKLTYAKYKGGFVKTDVNF